MQHRYLIEDCPFILDGTDTEHVLPAMVGEFTVNRRGKVECDALYLAGDNTKTAPNSCRTIFSFKETLGEDLTAFPRSQDMVESAIVWATAYIAEHDGGDYDAPDQNAALRLGHSELLGAA